MTLTDTGLSAGTLYYYKLVYTDATLATADSNEVHVETRTTVTANSLGMIPDSTDVGDATANAAALSSVFQLREGPLLLPIGAWFIYGSVFTETGAGKPQYGGRIEGGGGETWTLAENEYTAG